MGGFGGAQEFGDFSDFFQTFFGGGMGGFEGFGGAGAGPQAPDTSADVEYPVELTLEELLKGTARTLQVGTSNRLEVKIPPGLTDGSRIRMAGQGGQRRDGGRGDLFLRIRLRKHHRFEVRESDIHVEVEVPLTTSVLGGEAKVPTIDGEREIKVPPGSPPGRVFRLRELGLPKKGGGRGDLLATLQVALPRKVTGREKELFEELRRLGL
jgi:DnaJ-class molecular chaperone